mmetsp:Transcript_129394/g.242113  ORF Transcript_129394/g.242113 Transcript_129394/m.242113 type:complete len:263 (-) Transcript_129394:129-917(-)
MWWARDDSPSRTTHTGSTSSTGSTSGSTHSRVVDTRSRTVPSCELVPWLLNCGVSEVSPPSQTGSLSHVWAEADEVTKAENALREGMAGICPSALFDAIRWARSVRGIDRELLKKARRQLAPLQIRQKLENAITNSDADALEDALEMAVQFRLDAGLINRGRAKLATLTVDWLPLHKVTAEDVQACGADSSVPASMRECTICLETYREGETQAFLPCFHRFHVRCAQEWLVRRNECPVCKHCVCSENAGRAENASTAENSAR